MRDAQFLRFFDISFCPWKLVQYLHGYPQSQRTGTTKSVGNEGRIEKQPELSRGLHEHHNLYSLTGKPSLLSLKCQPISDVGLIIQSLHSGSIGRFAPLTVACDPIFHRHQRSGPDLPTRTNDRTIFGQWQHAT